MDLKKRIKRTLEKVNMDYWILLDEREEEEYLRMERGFQFGWIISWSVMDNEAPIWIFFT